MIFILVKVTDRQSLMRAMERIPRRKRVQGKETRIAQIQTAARKIFFKRGYQNSSIDEIAKAAGVSKGTVYLYFKSKDDLYVSLMIPVTEELSKELTSIKNQLLKGKYKTGKQVITQIQEAFYHLYDYDLDGLRIVFGFIGGTHFLDVSQNTLSKLNQVAKENFGMIRDIISTAKDRRFFSTETDPKSMPYILWATFLGIVLIEESKKRASRKDFLKPTLADAFSALGKGIEGS
jgi:TetR/AcrR family transcriptional regulator